MRTSATLQEKLRELVGEEVYHDGQLVKPVMAAFLLASDENQKAVNAIVHPAVADDFKASGYDWMECAILFESGFDHLVDCVICVTAPEEVRIQRVMARDGLTRERALDWLAKQFPIRSAAPERLRDCKRWTSGHRTTNRYYYSTNKQQNENATDNSFHCRKTRPL